MRKFKRFLSLALAIMMMVSLLPGTLVAHADDSDSPAWKKFEGYGKVFWYVNDEEVVKDKSDSDRVDIYCTADDCFRGQFFCYKRNGYWTFEDTCDHIVTKDPYALGNAKADAKAKIAAAAAVYPSDAKQAIVEQASTAIDAAETVDQVEELRAKALEDIEAAGPDFWLLETILPIPELGNGYRGTTPGTYYKVEGFIGYNHDWNLLPFLSGQDNIVVSCTDENTDKKIAKLVMKVQECNASASDIIIDCDGIDCDGAIVTLEDDVLTISNLNTSSITIALSDTELNMFPHNVDIYTAGEPTAVEPTPTDPAIKTASLTLGGVFGVNLYTDIPDSAKADGYMEFTIAGRGGTTTQIPFSESLEKNADGCYKFSFNTNSVQMADEITATYHYGEKATEPVTLSVKQYLDTVRTGNYTAEAKALAEAIADYGHYAQKLLSSTKGWTIGDDHVAMPNVNDLSEYRPDLSFFALKKLDNAEGVTLSTYSLNLDSETSIYLYFTRQDTAEHTFSVNGQALKATVDAKNRYKVEIPNITALRLSVDYIVVVDGKTLAAEVSALSYANAVLSSDKTSDTEKNAMAALYNYCNAALNYKK